MLSYWLKFSVKVLLIKVIIRACLQSDEDETVKRYLSDICNTVSIIIMSLPVQLVCFLLLNLSDAAVHSMMHVTCLLLVSVMCMYFKFD